MQEFSQDPALVQAFLVESTEFLQSMDQDLVLLERTPENEELLNRIFRALHTIKGTAGFFGFHPIVQLGHRAEDVLSALRRHDIHVVPRVMTALLAARDRLGEMLADLGSSGLKSQYAIEGLVAELEAVTKTSSLENRDDSQLERVQNLCASFNRKDKDKDKDNDNETAIKQVSAVSNTMRVDVRKLDDLINLTGELILERNRIVQLAKEISSNANAVDSPLSHTAARLSFITEELQTAALRTRMVPVETVFSRFPRLVRDLSQSLNKDAGLIVRGQDTEIDRTMVELLSDPLVHLVRNALDHGLEPPEERERAGKPRQGTISIQARQEGDHILVSVSDDGAGIDPTRILAKAIERKLVTAERAASLTPREILDLIFLPAFSTAEKTTAVSGRGVGMDVVRTNLKRMNGSVELQSRVGHGTTVLMQLPLTLAVLPVLLVQIADEIYALPLRAIIETTRLSAATVHVVDGREVVRLRDEMLPLVRLRSLCSVDPTAQPAEEKIVVLAVAEQRIALLVDRLIGQESTVIKPLAAYLHDCAGIAGVTVCGDGRVRLMLDPGGLWNWAAGQTLPAVLQ
jgi:two-component system chemotaxis sensor kinase CheA